MIIKDESNNTINHHVMEAREWQLAKEHVKPHHVVLELGARYGSCSVAINENLSNKTNQVSIEPDSRVWLALENNKILNDGQFNILKGAISKNKVSVRQHDYSTYTFIDENGTTQVYDLWEIEKMYNLKFNALVADCEGCLSVIINDYPEFFKQLELVIYEEDCADKCDYGKLKSILSENGFNHIVQAFHNVHVK